MTIDEPASSTSTLAEPNVRASAAPQPVDKPPPVEPGSQNITAHEGPEGINADEKTTPDSVPELQRKRDFYFLPIPRRLWWDPNRTPQFGYPQRLIFAFSAGFGAANLYYAQPILITLARDFNVSYGETTIIPTLLQVSYAVGLVFLCPLGDLVRRRQLLLTVIFLAAMGSLILALVPNLMAFEIVSALQGMVSVCGQILIPLSADLSPVAKRADAIGTVLAGLLFGILLARVLSGAIADASSVANVFYFAFAAQMTTWILLYWTVPDYPAKNPHLSYFGILKTMCKYAVSEPLLIQGCLVSGLCSAIFTCFWVTSTFILGDVYGYNSAKIGLFGVIGMAGVACAMVVGKIIDRTKPWVVAGLGLIILLVSMALYTGAIAANVAVVVIVVVQVLDLGSQLQQIAISTRVFGISEAGRARLSALFIFSVFLGQIIGTSAGSKIYLEYGGYRASGAFGLALVTSAGVVHCLRGPNCPNNVWFGWQGGWGDMRAPSKEKPSLHGVAEELAEAKVEEKA